MNFLDSYVDTIESIPLELGRDLTVLQELDTQVNKLIDDSNRKLSQLKQSAPTERASLINELDAYLDEVICKSEEKVALATKSYEFIDKQIRRLDDDLMRFDADFQLSEAEFAQLKRRLTSQSNLPSQTLPTTSKSIARQPPMAESNNTSKRNGRPIRKAADKTLRKLGQSGSTQEGTFENAEEMELSQQEPVQETDSHSAAESGKPSQAPNEHRLAEIQSEAFSYGSQRYPSVENVAPFRPFDSAQPYDANEHPATLSFPSEHGQHPTGSVDPNEPKYCYCNQVSYGEMIACDNENCEIEWFHYDCVGLKMPPKGRWYCNECMQKKKKGLIK